MAQAADCRIGFRSAAKASRCDDDSSLSDLHAWQASSAGMAAAEIFGLASTISDLKELATTPVGWHLLTAELADLELIQAEITRLISQLRTAGEIAA